MSSYDTLEIISYIIKENSTLDAVIPLGKSGVAVTNIIGPFKRGTYATTQDNPNGQVIFSILTDRIKFNYKTKADFYEDDSFEFMIYYNDGTSALRIIDMKVMKVFTDDKVSNKFLEIWIEDGSDIATLTLNSTMTYAGTTLYPTKISMSNSDNGLSVEKDIAILNENFTYRAVIDAQTKTTMEGTATVLDYIPSGVAGMDVKYLPIVKLDFTRTLPYDRENYCIVRFKEFLSEDKAEWVYHEECYYIIVHMRKVTQEAVSAIITIPEYVRPDKPVFTIANTDYPKAPINIKPEYQTKFISGDLLEPTKAHAEYDKYQNRTIRLGDAVPEGAVNLGYYYNAVASFNDTISIQETNTNVLGVQYAEDWITKNGCPTKDDDQFPDSVEFNGKKGTPLEGYYGILARDFVAWDEKIDIDQDPEAKTIYEQFRGMEINKTPMTTYYDDGVKSGWLTYTHAQYMPLDFFQDPHSIYTNDWEMPRYWLINAKYEGIVSKKIILYNGTAKYSGIVTKKDGLSNIDPEQDKELRLYPDENGVLYTLDGKNLLDDELFYVTDRFKDDTPLYFKYRLKLRIYNSLGKDKYGNYQVDNIKLVTENHMPLPPSYKFKVFLEETMWKDIYDAYVYTSFIPTPSNPIYVMYDGIAEDAYVAALTISPLNVRVGIVERISVIQAMDVIDDYTVQKSQGITEQSTITMKKFEVIPDERNKLRVQYVISAGGVKTPPIDAEIINKKYAIYSELNQFKDDDMIISTQNNAGYMTAKEILLKFAGESNRLKVENAKVFKVGLNLHNANTMAAKEKVIIYTDPDGNGMIYARTYIDTGLANDIEGDIRYNRTLDADSIYREQNGRIYKGFAVRCRNINQIVIAAPDDTSLLKDWYPKIKYSYFNKVYQRMNVPTQLIYSVPEFHTQVWGIYGEPFKDIENEVPRFVGKNTIKTMHSPMYVKLNSAGDPINIRAVRILKDGTKKQLAIESFNFQYGYVTFQEQLSDNDNILINYTYEEQYFHYKGYYLNQDEKTRLIDLNINPSMYSTYTDTENEIKENQPTYNLFNKTIFFFLRPMRRISNDTGSEKVIDNRFTIYHKFNNQEAEEPFDLLIGRIFVRHHASQKSTTLIDTRSRGGGVIEAMADNLRRELEPDSDFYMDIGTLDGKPYQENSVLVIRFDKRILRVNGGQFSEEEVREAVQKWSAYGMYPIIEYVDIIPEDQMPQSTLKINKHIENQDRYNPYIQAEVLDI